MNRYTVKNIILSILILGSLIQPTYAQSSANILQNIEDQRIQRLITELGLTIPQETDNPNHVISFKDPSGKGVKLEIDGQGFKTIKSPYTLPSLGIGAHVLTFRFTDSEQSAQTLDMDMVVVPRPPVVNAPDTISKSEISINGTALASSTVEIFISGDTLNFKATTNVSDDGTWEYTFKENFKQTVYTVIARTKKKGFSSSLSQPVVFEYSTKESNNNNTSSIKPIHFSFNDITPGNSISTIRNNPHLLVFGAFFLLLGVLATALISSLSNRKSHRVAEGKFRTLLNSKEKTPKSEVSQKSVMNETPVWEGENRRMTLKEKFEKSGFKLTQIDNTPKVLEKEEFMEAYKKEDPDNSKGVEKKESIKDKEEKKKVSVSLTSKKL